MALKAFMQRENVPNLKVWTSSLQRTIQTAALFEDVTSFKALDELNAGQFEVLACRVFIIKLQSHKCCDGAQGSTYEEIKEKYPQVNESRSLNKYYYRYHGHCYEVTLSLCQNQSCHFKVPERRVIW